MSVLFSLINKDNFYSKTLSGDFLRLYNSSVENLSCGIFTTRLTFSKVSNIQSDLDKVIHAVLYGCPELFFVGQEVGISISGNEVVLNFKNKYANEDLLHIWNILDNKINLIAEEIRKIPSAYDKINYLNEYLCKTVAYTMSTDGIYGDPYGALILNQARCEGFAKTAKIILDRVGMNSIIAFGEGLSGSDTFNHAWNIIEYESRFYHFDFTWNSSKTQHGIPGQEYMFLDDLTSHIEHFPQYKYPQCDDPSNTFWARHNGIINYQADLGRVDVVQFDNNFIAIAKLPEELSEYELNDSIFVWMRDELAGYNYGRQYSYSYNQNLNLLVFYFFN